LKTNDFRCDVSRCATSEVEIFLLITVGSQTEIDDDRLQGIATKHDVFRLKVTMHDSQIMHVLQTIEKSTHQGLYLLLSKASLSVLDDLEESLACEEFENNID
jgi:hypothetical protein